jgi:hypothetical protein
MELLALCAGRVVSAGGCPDACTGYCRLSSTASPSPSACFDPSFASHLVTAKVPGTASSHGRQRHASLVGADPARVHSRYLAVWLVDAGACLRSLFAPVRSLFHGNTRAYIVERTENTNACCRRAAEQDSKLSAVKGKHYRLLLHAGAASPTSTQAEYWPRKRESQSDFWQENHRSHTIYPTTHLAEGKENCLCRRCEYVRIQLKRLSRQETQ